MKNNEDCQDCLKRYTCNTPCLYVELVTKLAGKHKSIRERLSPPDTSHINNLEMLPGDTEPTNIDYNNVVARNNKARAEYIPTTIKEVRVIKDILKKSVAAMLYARMSIIDICIVLDKSESTIRRICRQ